MTPTFDRRRAVPRLAVLATTISSLALGLAAGLVAGLVGPAPAGAHARVSGSAPADGSDVEALPERVSISFSAKPVTPEGDPLLVYDPTGRRIDDGDVRVERGGQALSVGLMPGAAGPTGRYEVVYRVVSADTHVVAGHLGFTVTAPAAASTTGWMRLVQPEQHHRLRAVDGPDRRFELLAAVTVAVVLVARYRSLRARPRQPLPAPVVWRRPGADVRRAGGG
jgi:methionine-rich copper-binding protein CopC